MLHGLLSVEIKEAARAWAADVESAQSVRNYALPAREFLGIAGTHFPDATLYQLLRVAQKFNVPTRRLDWQEMDLQNTSFKSMDLTENNFNRCNLQEAVFDSCNLRYAKFRDTNLSSAYFRYCYADFTVWTGAILKNASLWGCVVEMYDLSQAQLDRTTMLMGNSSISPGAILQLAGLPSGTASVWRDHAGDWWVRVGCWSGTVAELRALVAQDDGWPEAEGKEIEWRRPSLEAFCDTADAHIKYWDNHAD